MTGQAGLERGYRRLLACYPRSFRRESEQEILAVLVATAREGQQRPGLAESADLIRGALRMRLRPGVPRPRAVLSAVRLMYAGAVLELAAVITIVATAASLRSAILQRNPGFTAAQWHAVHANLVTDYIGAPIVIGLWLWMAWANGRGYDWARVVFAAFFGIISVSLLIALVQDSAVYARADLIAGAVQWLVALAAVALIFSRQSWPYYAHEPAVRS
jgi:hypothetical protein